MEGASITQAKQALQMALDRLQPGDRFNVIEFNSVTRSLFGAPMPVDPATLVAGARKFVASLRARGGTEMKAALEAALTRDPAPGFVRQVVFLTDGAVGNEGELIHLIRERLDDRRLFTIGIGSAPNSYFLTKAAHFGRGTFTYIGDVREVAEKMGALFRKLESPVLTDLSIAWPGKADAWPRQVPDLYAGEPVVVVAELDSLAGDVSISGKRGGSAWSASLPLAAGASEPGIGVLWARAKIEALTDALKGGESEIGNPQSDRRRRARPPPREQVHEPRRGRRHTDGPAGNHDRPKRVADESPRRLVVRCAVRWHADGNAGDAPPPGGPGSARDCGVRVAVAVRRPAYPQARMMPRGMRTLRHLQRSARPADAWLPVPVGVDRGGPFDHRDVPPRNWMHARAPGIAVRFPKVESSPVDAASSPRRDTKKGAAAWIAATSLAAGLALTGNAVYLHAKALLAQILLHRAWTQTQATGAAVKPWPWADTSPVARLFAPAQDVDLLVLAGATGRTLAFGPGHHDGSAMPGEAGNAVLSAHRDTHFQFLRALAIGDVLIVESPAGRHFHYRVREAFVVDQHDLKLPRLPLEPTLTLITCYPFDAVSPGGPLRYVVVATAEGGTM